MNTHINVDFVGLRVKEIVGSLADLVCIGPLHLVDNFDDLPCICR
jgi:hypothetical protein